jgi:IS30 family transposase
MAKNGIGRPRKIKYKRLTPAQRGEIIAYIKLKMGNKEIARRMKCYPCTIREFRKKYQETKQIEDLPRSGRPRITTAAEDRNLKFKSLKDRWLTAVALRRTTITKQGRRPCVTTVRK